jgi:hypothetical protein
VAAETPNNTPDCDARLLKMKLLAEKEDEMSYDGYDAR